jgi:O-acetyl-ADP-ribose deacetylase (regulator of RNase III)
MIWPATRVLGLPAARHAEAAHARVAHQLRRAHHAHQRVALVAPRREHVADRRDLILQEELRDDA